MNSIDASLSCRKCVPPSPSVDDLRKDKDGFYIPTLLKRKELSALVPKKRPLDLKIIVPDNTKPASNNRQVSPLGIEIPNTPEKHKSYLQAITQKVLEQRRQEEIDRAKDPEIRKKEAQAIAAFMQTDAYKRVFKNKKPLPVFTPKD